MQFHHGADAEINDGNSTDPITSGRSMPILVGQTLCIARIGRVRRFANMKAGTETTSAAIMTTARLGSQAPKMSRKANTKEGRILPPGKGSGDPWSKIETPRAPPPLCVTGPP